MNEHEKNMEAYRKMVEDMMNSGNTNPCMEVENVDTSTIPQFFTVINKSGDVLFHDKMLPEEFEEKIVNLFDNLKEVDDYSNRTFVIYK
jgi:nicotinate-nucleotide pyrophosphorylase